MNEERERERLSSKKKASRVDFKIVRWCNESILIMTQGVFKRKRGKWSFISSKDVKKG